MFKILDPKITSELYLLRSGWLSPQYNLTDDVSSYGSMTYSGLSRRKAVVNTASGTLIFKRMGLLSRTVAIVDEKGTEVGRAIRGWFSHSVSLTLQTGFNAEFTRLSIWSRKQVWVTKGERIMQITSHPFSVKDIVDIDDSAAPSPIIPMLIFLGEHLIILRRRRRAAR